MRNAFRGFTLLELMVVIAIMGILMAISVPFYKDMVNPSRIAAEMNLMVGTLQYARAEAIKQGKPVTACISTNGSTCVTTGTNWHSGWIVFSDTNGNGVVNTGENVLRIQAGFVGTDTFVADNNVRSITFNREGFALGLPANPVTIKLHETSNKPKWTRCLAISLVGQLTTQKVGTGSCS